MAGAGRSGLNMKPGAALETPPHRQGKSKLEKEGESSLRPSPADRGTLPHQPLLRSSMRNRRGLLCSSIIDVTKSAVSCVSV